jgi:hypothetical protein
MERQNTENSKNPEKQEKNYGISKSVHNQIKEIAKSLYESNKKDLALSEFTMKSAINNVENWVKNGELKRDIEMKAEFEREKEYKLNEQKEVINQIDLLNKNNYNEKIINHFNEKIHQQENLYNKYLERKNEITEKINNLNKIIPEFEKKVKMKSEKLKFINKENLKLMDQINLIEKNNLNNSFNFTNNNNDSIINEQNFNLNISEIVEENEDIKNQYQKIIDLKKIYNNKKKENENLIKGITEMNSDIFLFKKIFNEGLHEIAKELLKIHEIQLDKVINSQNQKNDLMGNNLYFEIVKQNFNGNEQKNDEMLKLPIINSNIQKKYNYPVNLKTTSDSLVYKVIKNMLENSNNLNKILNMKKNKFSWEEFKTFSAYQIYTILNINKDVIKKVEGKIFPLKIEYPNDDNKLKNSQIIKDED